jgi:acyl dehydratase
MTNLAGFSVGQKLPLYTLRAHNTSTASENKIHDDSVARQYGFAGGLVPGVDVYAYMTHPVVEAFGRDWLDHGQMTARFLKPFYEGAEVRVQAVVTRASADALTLDLEATNDSGELCAVGTASLPASPLTPPAVADFPKSPLPASRPPVSEEALRAPAMLGTIEDVFDAESKAPEYLDSIRDDLPVFRGAGALAHPGYLIRFANSSLARNVLLGPWIHVSSEVTNFTTVSNGDALSTRGKVLELFERKGHKFVDLDVLVVANETTPVVHIHHTAIYDIRKVGDA